MSKVVPENQHFLLYFLLGDCVRLERIRERRKEHRQEGKGREGVCFISEALRGAVKQGLNMLVGLKGTHKRSMVPIS